MCEELVKKGTFVRLNEKFVGKNSFLARTDERDVARHESRMFICTNVEEDIGHGRNWAQQTDMTDVRRATVFVHPLLASIINY